MGYNTGHLYKEESHTLPIPVEADAWTICQDED